MDWKLALEIFCAVTGVAYALLEIVQWRAMWIVGIVTGAACAVVVRPRPRPGGPP